MKQQQSHDFSPQQSILIVHPPEQSEPHPFSVLSAICISEAKPAEGKGPVFRGQIDRKVGFMRDWQREMDEKGIKFREGDHVLFVVDERGTVLYRESKYWIGWYISHTKPSLHL